MNQKLFFGVTLFFFLFTLIPGIFAQEKINLNDIKLDISRYIFYGTPAITKSNDKGVALADEQYKNLTAPKFSTFTVHGKSGANYTIRFEPWSKSKGVFEKEGNHLQNIQKALQYNYLVPAASFATFQTKATTSDKTNYILTLVENAFFTIPESDLKEYAYIYNPKPKYEFNFGTISYLARMRPETNGISGRWGTDLNLGLAAGYRRSFGKNVGLSLLLGIAITKVSLDSISTKGFVKGISEKPALTPSANLLFSFQNVSVGIGIGMDWINKDSDETKAWIYNKKIFYAVGFGINIFRSSSNENTTASKDQ